MLNSSPLKDAGKGPGDRSDTVTVGSVMLARLKQLGVDYVFCNSGTDFPPIIEGLADAAANDVSLPEALVIPQESAALGMAHGYYFATGKAQAVMLHTNVGLANGAMAAINAAADGIPMILMSGRTPVTERGRFGGRSVPVGWGQEMRDQAALVREACKWDYELRFPEQIDEILIRAHAIANSTPKGPVYLSLPREVLCETLPKSPAWMPSSMAAVKSGPSAEAIETAARWMSEARRPLVIAQRGAATKDGFANFARLLSERSIPICQWWAVSAAVPTDHPCYIGADPEPWLSEADVILVLDSLAPWSPAIHVPRPDARIIQIGPDPLFTRVPVRNFRSDLSIACEIEDGIAALVTAMSQMPDVASGLLMERRALIVERRSLIRAKLDVDAQPSLPMRKDYVSRCLSEAIRDKDAVVLSELGSRLDMLTLKAHDSWHLLPHSGGLGWAFPCAMGIQLADRARLIVATIGDGSYIFSNPVACHQIAEALDLPVLLIVLNNSEWAAVRHSVLNLYPDGYAARANAMPLTSLQPSPDFTKVAQASRGYAVQVEDPEQLPAALAAAIAHIERNRTQALVEVRIR